MAKLVKFIDNVHFENEHGEYLDIEYHIEGYIEINLETSTRFTFTSENDIDEVCNVMKELLKQKRNNPKKKII